MRHTVIRVALFIFSILILWVALIFLASAVIESRVPVNLVPFSSVSQFSNEYVSATGTWVIEGHNQAFPLQTTQIQCERKINRCTSATAQVMIGGQLHAHLDTYEIVNWEKARIVFLDDSPTCVSYIYTIDAASKSVGGVRRKKQDATGVLDDCAKFDRELRLSLRGGLEVTRKLQEEANPWFGQIVFAPFKLFQ